MAGLHSGPLLATFGNNDRNCFSQSHDTNDTPMILSKTGPWCESEAGQETLGTDSGLDSRTFDVTGAVRDGHIHRHQEIQHPTHRPLAHRLGRRPNAQPSMRTDIGPRGANFGARKAARPRPPIIAQRGAPRARGKKRGKGGNRHSRPSTTNLQSKQANPDLPEPEPLIAEIDPDDLLKELESYFSDDTGMGVQTNDSSTPRSVSRDHSTDGRGRSPPAQRENGWR